MEVFLLKRAPVLQKRHQKNCAAADDNGPLNPFKGGDLGLLNGLERYLPQEK